MTDSDRIREQLKMNIYNDLKATEKFDEATLDKFKEVWDEVSSKYVFTEKTRQSNLMFKYIYGEYAEMCTLFFNPIIYNDRRKSFMSEKIYEAFTKVLNKIENSNMSLDEQMELLREMERDISFQKQQIYAYKNEM